MNEPTTLGAYLRRERERRGLALRTISESTKVSVPLLEGLEADDLSRWPGGIFRRAFVRSYAQCVGLDPDDVIRRFEKQHSPAPDPATADNVASVVAATPQAGLQSGGVSLAWGKPLQTKRIRLLGTVADLMVALVLAFGSAAAGSRLLWPVMLRCQPQPRPSGRRSPPAASTHPRASQAAPGKPGPRAIAELAFSSACVELCRYTPPYLSVVRRLH
jgi:hypothetical protein